MERKKVLVLLIGLLFLLVSCKPKKKIEVVNLYPAYEIEDNIKKWGYINKKGNFLIRPTYTSCGEFNGGLAIVELNGLFGLVNREGLEILKPEFSQIIDLGQGFYAGYRQDKIGLYTEEGPISIDQYNNIEKFSDGVFAVSRLTKEGIRFGYIDQKGREIIGLKYDMAYDFKNNRAVVKEKGSYKLINKKGREVKKLKYSDIRELNEPGRYAFLEKPYGFGVLDEAGNILVKPKYKSIISSRDGLFVVSKEILKEDDLLVRLGVVNSKSEEVTDFIYKDIEILGEDSLALSKGRGRYGKELYAIVDTSGKPLVKGNYYNVGGEKKTINQKTLSLTTGDRTLLVDLGVSPSRIIEEAPGYGEITSYGEVVRYLIDGSLVYYNDREEIIWETDNRFKIDGSKEVLEKVYNNKPGIAIKYPYFIGFKNREVQGEINESLEGEFLEVLEEDLESKYIYYKSYYSLDQKNKIIVVSRVSSFLEKDSKDESISKNIYNINLETGYFYRLKDVVKDNSYGQLQGMINEKLRGISFNRISLKDVELVNENSSFKLENNKLVLLLDYNLKGASEKNRTISFRLEELEGIIDRESEFMKIIS